jgi:hypothetical protein
VPDPNDHWADPAWDPPRRRAWAQRPFPGTAGGWVFLAVEVAAVLVAAWFVWSLLHVEFRAG